MTHPEQEPEPDPASGEPHFCNKHETNKIVNTNRAKIPRNEEDASVYGRAASINLGWITLNT